MRQVTHNIRSGAAQNVVHARTEVAAPNNVVVLANMYQRIPGEILAAVKDKLPLNYAVLEHPASERIADIVKAPHCGPRDSPTARWTTHTYTQADTFQSALLRLEHHNLASDRAAKFKLNFSDGVQLTFARSSLRDPASLRCVTMYDPAAGKRHPQRPPLDFVVDGSGHLLRRRAASPQTYRPDSLYRHCPAPTTGHVGYAFTPMSYISYLVKPNSYLRGCRPNLRETNPAAVHYRPRVLSRPYSTFEPEAPIDGRNSVSPLAPGNRAVSAHDRTHPTSPVRA